MKTVISVLAGACVIAVAACPRAAVPDDETRTVGQALPDATLINDRGERFQLSEIFGGPLIISPVFCRCGQSCSEITSHLRDVSRPIEGLGDDYNILTLSFDPGDTVVDIAAYRERMGLPASWRVAIAAAGDLAPLLDAIDFRYTRREGGGFDHPDVLAVIDPDGNVAGYVGGVSFTEEDIRRALTSAWAGDSLVKKYRFWIVGIAATFALATLLVVVWTGRRRPGSQPA